MLLFFVFLFAFRIGFAFNIAPLHPRFLYNRYRARAIKPPRVVKPMAYPGIKGSISYVSSGSTSVLVIPFDFETQLHNALYTTNYLYNIVMSNEYSLSDYYLEVSYGKLKIDKCYVFDWITINSNYLDYGDKDYSSLSIAPLINHLLDTVNSNTNFNFGDFDLNHDGYVDHIILVHSGEAEEISGRSSDFYSHQSSLDSEYTTHDSYKIASYVLVSESSPLGIFCHEFGHDIGFVDTYDTSTGMSVLSTWDLMDIGAYSGGGIDNDGDGNIDEDPIDGIDDDGDGNIDEDSGLDGTSPVHPIAYHKIMAGWTTPKESISTTTLYPYEYYGSVFKLNTSLDSEYFLLEYRTACGYDRYIKGSGILITHINENEGSIDNNNINVGSDKRIEIIRMGSTSYYGSMDDVFHNIDIISKVVKLANDRYFDMLIYGISFESDRVVIFGDYKTISSVYPTPCNDYVVFKIITSQRGIAEIKILDISGYQMDSLFIDIDSGIKTITYHIDKAYYTNKLYVYYINMGNKIISSGYIVMR